MKTARRSQQGFTLLELAVVFGLMLIIIVGSITFMQYTRRIDEGRAVGRHMLKLNNAVVKYKTQYFKELSAMPVECGQSTYRIGQPMPEPLIGVHPAGSPNAGASLCSLVAKGVSMQNAMKPSLTHLKNLGFLEKGINEALILPIDPDRHALSATPGVDMPKYAVLIQRACKSTICDSATGPFQLKSYVFNPQPYRVDSNLFASGARLGAAVEVMEGRGYLSRIGGDGHLENMLHQHYIDNPVLNTTGVSQAYGILAAYDASDDGANGSLDDSQYTYRDGSRPPTDDWDFDNKSLRNVNELTAKSVASEGGITAKGAITAEGDITAKGAITTEGGITAKGAITTEGGITAKGAITTTGAMNAGSLSIASGGATVTGNTKLNNLAINAAKIAGTACATTEDSLAKNSAKPSAFLLCHEGIWVQMLADSGSTNPPTTTPVTPPTTTPVTPPTTTPVTPPTTTPVTPPTPITPPVAPAGAKAKDFTFKNTIVDQSKSKVVIRVTWYDYYGVYHELSPSLRTNTLPSGQSWSVHVPQGSTKLHVSVYVQILGFGHMEDVSDESYRIYGGCYTATEETVARSC